MSARPPQAWTTALDGHRLQQLRREHGLSQAELAGLAGVSPHTVARLESRPRPHCRCRTLARIAAALGEPPAALVPDSAP